jgi:tRNA threonylcarbamoyladenosine biosynthesis protein TsaB
MRYLVLDTADARGSVALAKEGVALSLESHTNEEDYSSWLLPAVDRVLAASSLTLSELDGYAVCSGPGSFTGLRVGLTTVKAWAEIHSKPIAAVSRLEALAWCELPVPRQFVAVCIDARRNQCFAALYKPSEETFGIIGEESVGDLADFMARVAELTGGQSVVWRTPDPAMIESAPGWQSLQAQAHYLEPVNPPFAGFLAQAAYRKFCEGKTTDGLSLDATYVRRSDAELYWKGAKSAVKV